MTLAADAHERIDRSLPDLHAGFDGDIITPDDVDYDDARTVFMGGPDRRPAVILRPADTAQVTRVVTLARDTGLPLAVRSGGHSICRHGVCDDGIVLDLSRMRALDIDVEQRTAWARPG
jgi:FAD/FMN-containing dehydrogenase